MAHFDKLDLSKWKRTPYFNLYFNQLRCTYSMTVNIDITDLLDPIRKRENKLSPTLIYVLTKIVNKYEEFRVAINEEGEIGIWSKMNPVYTIFHKESETFSDIWTEWNPDMEQFMRNYNMDMTEFGNEEGICPKPDMPINTFPISILPWSSFSSFNLNIFADGSYLQPIFTWGKYFEEIQNGTKKILIPLSIQAHHAVCDGFHVCRLINELQSAINEI